MSLINLGQILTQQADQTGSVVLNTATLSSAGFTVAAGLDALVQGSFNLASGTSLSVATDAGQIGTPTATHLTMSGNIRALGVTMANATIVFTASGSALTFTILAPLGTWTFQSSFPFMTGFPF